MQKIIHSALSKNSVQRGVLALAGILVLGAGLCRSSLGQEIALPVSPSVDKMIGAAVVAVPDYEGWQDFTVTGAPLLMYKSSGQGYVQLVGNKGFVNVLNHPNWELGLKGVYRIGRKSSNNSVVAKLVEVDNSFELGGFVGYGGTIDGDFRHRYNIHLDITQDVSGGHEGFVIELAGVY